MPWKYNCPRCKTHLQIYGRYPGTYRCPKCDRIWHRTIEGYLTVDDPWNDL